MRVKSNLKSSHLMLFYRRMASMAATGMGPSESIAALAESGGKGALARAAGKMHEDISGGTEPAVAMKQGLRHLSGLPDEMFERDPREMAPIYNSIAEHVERESSIESALRGIAMYPAVVGSIVVLIASVIMIFVVPVFDEMFEYMGGMLPLPTRMLIGLSHQIDIILPLLVLAIVIALVAFRRNRRLYHGFLYRLPVLGRASRRAAGAEFISVYSILKRLGVDDGTGMLAAASSVTNGYIAEKLSAMAGEQGGLDALAGRLEQDGYITDIAAHMLRAGERTDTVPTACSEAAAVLFEELDIFNRQAFGAATPLMILTLGLIVGFMVIALYLPIFTIMSNV